MDNFVNELILPITAYTNTPSPLSCHHFLCLNLAKLGSAALLTDAQLAGTHWNASFSWQLSMNDWRRFPALRAERLSIKIIGMGNYPKSLELPFFYHIGRILLVDNFVVRQKKSRWLTYSQHFLRFYRPRCKSPLYLLDLFVLHKKSIAGFLYSLFHRKRKLQAPCQEVDFVKSIRTSSQTILKDGVPFDAGHLYRLFKM